VIAALQPLRAQKVCDLIGAAHSAEKRQFCLLVAPASTIHSAARSRLSALTASSASNQSSAQLNGTDWASGTPLPRYRIGAVFEQKGTRFLECRHLEPYLATPRRHSRRNGFAVVA